MFSSLSEHRRIKLTLQAKATKELEALLAHYGSTDPDGLGKVIREILEERKS